MQVWDIWNHLVWDTPSHWLVISFSCGLPCLRLHARHHNVHSDPSLLTIDYFIFFTNVSLHNLFVDRCTNLFSQAKLRLMVEDKKADLVPFIDRFEQEETNENVRDTHQLQVNSDWCCNVRCGLWAEIRCLLVKERVGVSLYCLFCQQDNIPLQTYVWTRTHSHTLHLCRGS